MGVASGRGFREAARVGLLRLPRAEPAITRALDAAAFGANLVFPRQPAVVEERRGGTRPSRLALGTVAFNNVEVIRDQIAALSELLEDEYAYHVFDNSTDEGARAAIRLVCRHNDVSYFQLPANAVSRMNPSRSHGLAMNWGHRQVLARTGSPYFGFLDPDIYPTRSCSIIEAMGEQQCYGRLAERAGAWYLWAGFCFFRNPMPASLNFLPVGTLDTGGANWQRLYRFMDKRAMEFPAVTAETPDAPERVGDWVHLSNSSRWRDDHVGPRPAPTPLPDSHSTAAQDRFRRNPDRVGNQESKAGRRSGSPRARGPGADR
jgi:hypothetical protein